MIVVDSLAYRQRRIEASMRGTSPEVARTLEEYRLSETYGEHALPSGLVCSARLGAVESKL